jgi:hypothetical protein
MEKLAAMRTNVYKLLITGARFYRVPAGAKIAVDDVIIMRVTLADGDDSQWPQELDFEGLRDYKEQAAEVDAVQPEAQRSSPVSEVEATEVDTTEVEENGGEKEEAAVGENVNEHGQHSEGMQTAGKETVEEIPQMGEQEEAASTDGEQMEE